MILNRSQWVVIGIAALGCLGLATYPPWERGGYFVSHASVLSPPPPPVLPSVRLPTGELVAPPESLSIPARVDWGNLIRGELAIAAVGWVVVRVVRTRRVRGPDSATFSSFRIQTLGVSALLALVVPIPFPTGLADG